MPAKRELKWEEKRVKGREDQRFQEQLGNGKGNLSRWVVEEIKVINGHDYCPLPPFLCLHPRRFSVVHQRPLHSGNEKLALKSLVQLLSGDEKFAGVVAKEGQIGCLINLLDLNADPIICEKGIGARKGGKLCSNPSFFQRVLPRFVTQGKGIEQIA
nr:importin subunit alpha [Ipomoea batatas]